MTITKPRKLKAVKYVSVIMAIMSFSFMIMTSIWLAKTNTFVDEAITTGVKNRAILAIVMSLLALGTSVYSAFIAFKKKELLMSSLMLLLAFALVFVAFLLPLHDEKLLKDGLALRKHNRELYLSLDSRTQHVFALEALKNKSNVIHQDTLMYLGKDGFAKLNMDSITIGSGDATAILTQVTVTPKLLADIDNVVVGISKVLDDGLLNAQSDIHDAAISVFATLSGLSIVTAILTFTHKTKAQKTVEEK